MKHVNKRQALGVSSVISVCVVVCLCLLLCPAETLDVIVIRSMSLCSTLIMHNPPAPKWHTHIISCHYAAKVTHHFSSSFVIYISNLMFNLTSMEKKKSVYFRDRDYVSFGSIQCVYWRDCVSFVCFCSQQSVLAALYSSEGSVMEVSSQPFTLLTGYTGLFLFIAHNYALWELDVIVRHLVVKIKRGLFAAVQWEYVNWLHFTLHLPVMLSFPPWQRHHFAQAIAILNTHGCNIFEKFSRKVRYKIWRSHTDVSHFLFALLQISYSAVCLCKLKLSLCIVFVRTTSACWIWWET